MDLQVAKWGNCLASRIPSEVVRRLWLREGSTVQTQLGLDSSLLIRPAQWNREAFALELTEDRSNMPTSESVMEELRSGTQYRDGLCRHRRTLAVVSE